MNNYFFINRSLFDNEIWLKEPFTKAQAWIDLIGNANHHAGSFVVRGNEVKIARGQIGWSQITMTKRWKWSRQKVRRFLEYLVTEGMAKIDNSEITSRQIEKTTQQNGQQKGKYLTTILTIVNYSQYQNDTADDTTERQQTIHKQIRTNKNKEDINININTQAGNTFVNRVLDSFKKSQGFNPTDPKPRFEAFNLVRRIKKLLKEVGREETDDQVNKVIDKYFSWLNEQEWMSNVQNMSVVRRKFEIYQQYVINHIKPNVQKEN